VAKTASQIISESGEQLKEAVATGINTASGATVGKSQVDLSPADNEPYVIDVAVTGLTSAQATAATDAATAGNLNIDTFRARGSPNEPFTAYPSSYSDADVLGENSRQDDGQPDSGDGSLGAIVGGVVGGIAFIAIVGFLLLRNGGGGGGSGTQYKPNTYANQAFQNPTNAPSNAGGGIPSWADPNVPFLSRAEAEGQLQNRGFQDGDFVVRQTHNAPHCFVITSCMGGNVHNSQIKYENGVYMYGPKRVGGTLDDVLNSLKSSVQISPPSGGQSYNIKGAAAGGAAGGAGYLELMSDA